MTVHRNWTNQTKQELVKSLSVVATVCNIITQSTHSIHVHRDVPFINPGSAPHFSSQNQIKKNQPMLTMVFRLSSYRKPLLQPSTMLSPQPNGFEQKENQTIIESTYQREAEPWWLMDWIQRSIPRPLVTKGTQRMTEHHGWRLTVTNGGWPFLPGEDDRVLSRRHWSLPERTSIRFYIQKKEARRI